MSRLSPRSLCVATPAAVLRRDTSGVVAPPQQGSRTAQLSSPAGRVAWPTHDLRPHQDAAAPDAEARDDVFWRAPLRGRLVAEPDGVVPKTQRSPRIRAAPRVSANITSTESGASVVVPGNRTALKRDGLLRGSRRCGLPSGAGREEERSQAGKACRLSQLRLEIWKRCVKARAPPAPVRLT